MADDRAASSVVADSGNPPNDCVLMAGREALGETLSSCSEEEADGASSADACRGAAARDEPELPSEPESGRRCCTLKNSRCCGGRCLGASALAERVVDIRSPIDELEVCPNDDHSEEG